MPFDYTQIDLPVREVIPNVQAKLNDQNTLILKAPTGAGKSTLLPIALLEESWLEGKKIYMLEPRRIAAKTIAMRMADLLGEKVGQTVGYRIRFESKVSENTRLEVLTEGILTRMLQDDNALDDVGLIIFDEFHERSIHADLAMALTRECQQELRPDLKILVMSATIDMPLLSELLEADIVESEGRQFSVEVKNIGDADMKMLPELTFHAVQRAFKEEEGDILVFLPGQGEIKKCEGLIRSKIKGLQVHPLYGNLPPSKQFAAIMPDKEGRRKVVLATNIAETSLTIEGIKVVIDSGFERSAKFNPNSGLTRLETKRISKESAEQRKGRAGRLTEGVCYRLWTKATEARMEETGTPEIEVADLCNLMLDLAQWGVNDPNDLMWLSTPPRGHVAQALDLLHDLDALKDGKITEHGKALHQLPCHPRIAHMLLKAKEHNQLALATDIAPFLEEKDPLPADAGIDMNLRIQALRRYRKEGFGPKALGRLEKIAQQYRDLLDIEVDNEHYDEDETGVLIAFAYPERIACSRPGNNAQFQMANGRIAMAGHRDDLAHEAWLAIAHVSEREGNGKIFMASALNPQDLAPLVKQKEVIQWDYREGVLKASKDLCIGNIVLKSIPLPTPDESQRTHAICKAIMKDGDKLLNWDKEVEQWRYRVMSLKKWNKEQKWPDVSRSSLKASAETWLGPYLSNIKKAEDLKKLDLKEILQYSLDHDQQKALEQLAPEKIEVPSGSKIKLEYQENSSSPVLAVRLQECFGLEDTPKVNNGKQSVLMHLLSPGFKPVQVTADLRSFWQVAYFEVRKELRIRYKKHEWPEDPLQAEAIRGVKKKG